MGTSLTVEASANAGFFHLTLGSWWSAKSWDTPRPGSLTSSLHLPSSLKWSFAVINIYSLTIPHWKIIYACVYNKPECLPWTPSSSFVYSVSTQMSKRRSDLTCLKLCLQARSIHCIPLSVKKKPFFSGVAQAKNLGAILDFSFILQIGYTQKIEAQKMLYLHLLGTSRT